MGRFNISGQAIIVTGGAVNIGRDYCLGLAQEGARVCVVDVNEDAGRETVELIGKNGGEAFFFQGDVSDESSMRDMAAETKAQFGRIDALVNNAGIWAGLQFQDITEIEPALWDKVHAVNVKGIFLATRAVVPHMREQGGGVIVNQSSIGSYLGGPLLAHYVASKGAVNSLTKSFARDLGEDNIRCNAIAPGVIGTASTLENVAEELLDMLEMQQCLKRKGTPDDLLGALIFLLSDASCYMSGQVLVVDGGMVLLG